METYSVGFGSVLSEFGPFFNTGYWPEHKESGALCEWKNRNEYEILTRLNIFLQDWTPHQAQRKISTNIGNNTSPFLLKQIVFLTLQ